MKSKNLLIAGGVIAAFFLVNGNVNANSGPLIPIDPNQPLGGGNNQDFPPDEYGITPVNALTENDLSGGTVSALQDGPISKAIPETGLISIWNVNGKRYYILDLIQVAKLRIALGFNAGNGFTFIHKDQYPAYLAFRQQVEANQDTGGGFDWGKAIAVTAQVVGTIMRNIGSGEGQ